jgi:cation:H+ antiporter
LGILFMIVLSLSAGLVLLLIGGEALVRGAVQVAEKLRVSPLLVGLTVVGFGTSMPELVTSLQAARIGAPGIAVGNVVGSNIANILLILSVAALISPFEVQRKTFAQDGGWLLLATFAAVAAVLWGRVSALCGAALILGLAAYVYSSYRRETPAVQEDSVPVEAGPKGRPIWGPLILTVAGIAVTIVGARFLVSAAVDIAQSLGMSETVIGLTIVAVGTSLPELVASGMAAMRRQGGLAFGNVVGSNIFNILGILGVTSLVNPISIPQQIAAFDVWVMLASALLLIGVSITGWKITRAEGGVLLAGFAGYTAFLLIGGSS